MILKHPTRTQLITYAEVLVDGKGPIFSGIARHLSQCPQCKAEVDAICASLKFFDSAREVEPPKELTLEILKRAKEQRKQIEIIPTPSRRNSPIFISICVLIWLILGYYLFVEHYPTINAVSTPENINTFAKITTQVTKPTREKDVTRDLKHEIEVLGSALSPLLQNAQGYSIYPLKSVSVIDQELESAQVALRKNPGCPRANEILQKAMKEKAELLKQIYLDRML
ncbi:MAG TPA: hypothetical protein PLT82_07510 [Candidatus Hydrogenedens sp.]|nr:hypothetical protein [Candidatus Hydrogenedens sp.]HPP58963.1 hypothetical protein [Candidatus Hydrogenedens sp.]